MTLGRVVILVGLKVFPRTLLVNLYFLWAISRVQKLTCAEHALDGFGRPAIADVHDIIYMVAHRNK